MTVSLSELYGKKIITSSGQVLGTVQGVVMDFEKGAVSHLLLKKLEDLTRSGDIRTDFRKSSISYERVSKVGQTIIVQSSSIARQESE
jgi:sporulation protein YlmC with PRC-barrel domain